MVRQLAPCGTTASYKRGCRCAECSGAKSAYDRSRYLVRADEIKARVRQRKLDNPDLVKAEAAKYRATNRTELNEKAMTRYHSLSADEKRELNAKARAQRNHEAYLAYRKDWLKTPKGRAYVNVGSHRRRGIKATAEARQYAVILYADPCAYCGEAGGELDHIDAVTAGGDGDWSNLTAACRFCNASKNADPLLAFLTRTAA